MKPFRLFSQVLLLLGLVMACAAGSSKAAMQIDIYGPGQNIVNLAMAAPLSTGQPAQGLGKELDAAIHDNLSFLPFMRLTDPKAVLGGTILPGYQPPNVDFKRFQLAGADLLVTAGWPQGDKPGSTVELRVYETFSGQFVFGNAYSGVTKGEVQDVADRFCADLMKALTGHGDFFLSTLAFVKNSGKNKRDVWITKPTGRNLRKITDIPGIAMSPSWSLDGRFIVFSHMDDKSHALGVWDRLTNRVQRIRFPGNTVIGPTFTPGNKVAVSLHQRVAHLRQDRHQDGLHVQPHGRAADLHEGYGLRLRLPRDQAGQLQYRAQHEPRWDADRLFAPHLGRKPHLCAGADHRHGTADQFRPRQ